MIIERMYRVIEVLQRTGVSQASLCAGGGIWRSNYPATLARIPRSVPAKVTEVRDILEKPPRM